MNIKNKTNKGITLIALVITIIVLLILAGVTISLTFGENGILARAKEGKDKYAEAEQNEIDILDNLDYQFGTLVENGTVEPDDNPKNVANAPELTAGMIPVYYDGEKWKVAPKDNAENKWYEYTSTNKQWANIVTVEESKATEYSATTNGADKVGTEVKMNDITTFFVWVPRYAYSIEKGYKTSDDLKPSATGTKISVSFLKDKTNVGTDGVTYETDYDASKVLAGQVTPKIVHPAFGDGAEAVTGIWVAKFEASGTTSEGQAVGNRKGETGALTEADESTYVKVLPNVVSWRDISIGESQYQSMKMKEDTTHYGWTSDKVNSHLMKNSEFGAVAYLCYSAFGNVPQINANGKYGVNWYDFHTGAGPSATDNEERYEDWIAEKYGYNTSLGQLASTTGNVYGIYDMSGGAWELVAAYYDSGHGNLSKYGNSNERSGSKTEYFDTNNSLNEEYKDYWEAYEVSDKEKSNSIEVDGESDPLTQDQLWNASKNSTEAEQKRHDLTEETWNKLAEKKGIGMNEVGESWSYRGLVVGTGIVWKVKPEDTAKTYGKAWNSDYVLIGGAAVPFLIRGGDCSYEAGAGVLISNVNNGSASHNIGFRPTLTLN